MPHAHHENTTVATLQECCRLEAGPWRVIGFRIAGNDDRIAHKILLVDGQSVVELFTTVEGNASDVWPPSPPLQQLVVDQLTDRCEALLGVGLAGRSHWSASIHVDASSQLIIDMACRCTFDAKGAVSSNGAPMTHQPFLGSTYAYAPNVKLQAKDSHWIVDFHEKAIAIIQPIHQANIATNDNHLMIRADGLESTSSQSPTPKTVRWSFGVRTLA